jgi:hypothetical protein
VNALGCIGLAFALVDAFVAGAVVGHTATRREQDMIERLAADTDPPWPVHDSDVYAAWMRAVDADDLMVRP